MIFLFLIVGLNDLLDIVSEVHDITSRWWHFGLALHLLPQVLDTTKAKDSDPERCLSVVIAEFLKKNYDYNKFGAPSWKLIIQAVGNKVGGSDRALAEKIAKNHCIPGTYNIKSNVLPL